MAKVLVERVAEDIVRGALQIGFGPLNGAKRFALGLFDLQAEIGRLSDVISGHV